MRISRGILLWSCCRKKKESWYGLVNNTSQVPTADTAIIDQQLIMRHWHHPFRLQLLVAIISCCIIFQIHKIFQMKWKMELSGYSHNIPKRDKSTGKTVKRFKLDRERILYLQLKYDAKAENRIKVSATGGSMGLHCPMLWSSREVFKM